ncbi:DUF456 domain-containing protein [Planomicrobium sp. YIM 101495]|uniref:DUF456 domain-containing protein n=1 Tax=Planomicrobium sp. YIM 101495 TaxID=2665160 RepID=UPI0012B9E21C|nr:DUF456 domain-containing protein [Planomicrobium sp. YIM 101495]MTD29967.1 DUF456 family protein [Planomicrobium sp. YIM 101495]
MDILAWILILLCFAIGFVGLIYPIIPAVLFILGGFVVYGLFYSFADLPWWFWLIQTLFVVLLFGADTIANLFGVKRFGGSKAGMWGSTIGLIFGPFIIPIFGILIGPFAGAILAELIFNKTKLKQAVMSGVGSVVGFITSVFTKGILQVVMVLIFFFTI